MTALTLQTLASALNGEVRGDRVCFPTPGHSKKDRGSWASLVDSAPDGVLIHSSNGGDPLAIKDELRAKGLLPPLRAQNDTIPWRPPERTPEPAKQHAVSLGDGQGIVATFDYFDPHGELLYRKHRVEPGRDRSKEFAYDHPDGKGGWAAKRGVDPVPYRLPDIVSAPKDAPIYMAEGEAKADRLAEWGFLATSHKDWKGFEFSGYVRGRQVFILPDNDDTGEKLAKKALEDVERAEGFPCIVELPGLPNGGDILDWGGTADDLRALADIAREGEGITSLDLAALSKRPAKPKRFAIERLAPAAEVTLFTGPGSAGKSLLAQQLATAAAAGRSTLGFEIERMPAIYLTCEDDAEQLHWRQEHISAALNAPMATLDGDLHLVSLRGQLDNDLATFDQTGSLRPARAYHRLVAKLQATAARIAFLDNVAHLFTGNENDRGEVTRFVNLLNRLAGETGAAIVLLGHPNKAGDSYSGSTAWLNAVRSQFVVEHDVETDMRTLTIGKANYARKGDQTRFFWQDWAFVGEDELPPDRAREIAETQRAIADNDLFLTCLRERTRQQRAVSEKVSSTFAPKVFTGMAESKGIGKDRLEKAMERLFRIDVIERGELPWRSDDRKAVFGLRETAGDGAGNTCRGRG